MFSSCGFLEMTTQSNPKGHFCAIGFPHIFDCPNMVYYVNSLFFRLVTQYRLKPRNPSGRDGNINTILYHATFIWNINFYFHTILTHNVVPKLPLSRVRSARLSGQLEADVRKLFHHSLAFSRSIISNCSLSITPSDSHVFIIRLLRSSNIEKLNS